MHESDGQMDTAWWHRPHLCIASHCENAASFGKEYSQNGDRLKRRQAKTATPKRRQTKTATCLLEVNQNGDKRKWRHSLNKYVVPFHGCFPYTCGYSYLLSACAFNFDLFMLDIVVLFSCPCAIEV